MNWHEAEAHRDIAGLLRQLAALRERHPQLVAAQWKPLMVDNENETGLWQISMTKGNLYLALNRSESQRPLTVSHTILPVGAQIFNEITLQKVSMQMEQLWLPAESAFVFSIKG
jgi:pullulanase/glycogen debranching enzyme